MAEPRDSMNPPRESKLRRRTEPEPQLVYDPVAAAKGWQVARDAFVIQDEKMIKGYQDEIDSILIFAGIFSAILTAFVAQTYQNLKPNSADTTNSLLIQISQQLADPAHASVVTMPTDFQVSPSDLRVNTLWFVSLILSFGASIFAIFVKQWLRSYMTWVNVSPAQTAVTIRQYRYSAMLKWKLPEMVVFVPIQLQLALILFGIGLVDFTIGLNRTMGFILVGFDGLYLVVVLCVSFLPLFSLSTPYRSPWSPVLMSLRSVLATLSFIYAMFLAAPLLFILRKFRSIAEARNLRRMRQIVSYTESAMINTGIKFVEVIDRVSFGAFGHRMAWDEIDELEIGKSGEKVHSDDSVPSWEACSINALLLSAHDGNELFNAVLPCVLRPATLARDISSGTRLGIADCCVVAGWFFGMRARNVAHPEQWQIRSSDDVIQSLQPRTMENLYILLRFALNNYLDTDEESEVQYNCAARALKMLGHVLISCSWGREVDSVLEYNRLVMALVEKRDKKGRLRIEPNLYCLDSLFLVYCAASKAGVPAFTVTEIWCVNEDTGDAMLTRAQAVLGAIESQYFGELVRHLPLMFQAAQSGMNIKQTVEGQRILSLVFSLVARGQARLSYGQERQSEASLRACLARLAVIIYSKYMEHKNDNSANLIYLEPNFWQSVYLFTQSRLTAHPLSEAELLARYLCIFAQRLTHPSEDMDDYFIIIQELDGLEVSHMAENDVWDILAVHARWLGSQHPEAQTSDCPGFDRWTEPEPPAAHYKPSMAITPVTSSQLPPDSVTMNPPSEKRCPDIESHGVEIESSRLPGTSGARSLEV